MGKGGIGIIYWEAENKAFLFVFRTNILKTTYVPGILLSRNIVGKEADHSSSL